MLAQWNEVDLPGETHPEYDNIIEFPSSWEPDPPSAPAACALCEQEAELSAGLCPLCSMRLPLAGGCGMALRLVAGLTGTDGTGALAHLTGCRECRQFFDQLGDLGRVATFEADPAADPVAASLAA